MGRRPSSSVAALLVCLLAAAVQGKRLQKEAMMRFLLGRPAASARCPFARPAIELPAWAPAALVRRLQLVATPDAPAGSAVNKFAVTQTLFEDHFTTIDTSSWSFHYGDGSDYGIKGKNNQIEQTAPTIRASPTLAAPCAEATLIAHQPSSGKPRPLGTRDRRLS